MLFPRGMDANAFSLKVTPAVQSLGLAFQRHGVHRDSQILRHLLGVEAPVSPREFNRPLQEAPIHVGADQPRPKVMKRSLRECRLVRASPMLYSIGTGGAMGLA